MKTGIKVQDAMTKAPVCVGPEKTILDCSKLMKEKNIGSLIITSKNKEILGLITVKDILKKGVVPGKDLVTTKVRDLMTKDVVTLNGHEDIYEAMVLMRNEDFRRIPVVENKKIRGYLTHKDILKLQPSLYELFVEKQKMNQAKFGMWNPISKIKRFIK